MKKTLIATSALIVALGSIAILQRQGNAQAQGQPQGRLGQQSQNLGAEFVKNQIQCNMFEVQASQLVADKAQNEQIKEFAQMMVQEHQKAIGQLKELAKETNAQVPQGLEQWQQAKLEMIRQVPAGDLERKYIFHQVGMHQTEVLEHRFVANQAQEPQVKQFAARMATTLRDHQRHAERIAHQYAGITGEPTGPQERQGLDTPERNQRQQ